MTIQCGAPDLKNKFRTLIRYHYSESDYNTHFGGTPLETLLFRDNPITDYRTSWNTDEYDEALQEILDPGYYQDLDIGISLFAGYSDGMPNFHLVSLKRDFDRRLRELRQALSDVNHFLLEEKPKKLIQPLMPRIESRLERGTALFRSRIGFAARAYPMHGGDWFEERHYRPYEAKTLGAPPPPVAGIGRMNRAGVSFLYLASTAETALAEIRPHPGHYCSIGSFRAQRTLRIADLTDLDPCDFAISDRELENFVLLRSIDEVLSVPVVPESREQYHLSQLLADAFRQLCYDGACYRSPVGLGKNYVLFDPATFEYEAGSATVARVDNVTYVSAQVPNMGTDDNDYWTAPDGSFL